MRWRVVFLLNVVRDQSRLNLKARLCPCLQQLDFSVQKYQTCSWPLCHNVTEPFHWIVFLGLVRLCSAQDLSVGSHAPFTQETWGRFVMRSTPLTLTPDRSVDGTQATVGFFTQSGCTSKARFLKNPVNALLVLSVKSVLSHFIFAVL